MILVTIPDAAPARNVLIATAVLVAGEAAVDVEDDDDGGDEE